MERAVRKIEKLERTFKLLRVPLKRAVVCEVGKLSFENFFPTTHTPISDVGLNANELEP